MFFFWKILMFLFVCEDFVFIMVFFSVDMFNVIL